MRQFYFKDDHSPVYDYARYEPDSPGSARRSIYRFVVRSVTDPFLDTLDCADPSLLTPKRSSTTTALQALAMLNDPFVTRQAEHLADRVARAEKSPTRQIELAYRIAFGRVASPEELMAAKAYLPKHGLANFCRLLFNTNEFMFVD